MLKVAACNAAVADGIEAGAECSTEVRDQWIDEVANILVQRDRRIANAATNADDSIDSCISNYGGWTGECADRYGV